MEDIPFATLSLGWQERARYIVALNSDNSSTWTR